jgi:hypothetical protein
MTDFKINDKALWRGKIPVVIVDGYEGIPHKRTVKMDVEGDVFEWDVKVSELSREITAAPALPQNVIEAWKTFDAISYTYLEDENKGDEFEHARDMFLTYFGDFMEKSS